MTKQPLPLQLPEYFAAFDALQLEHGDKDLNAIYGAGCTTKPDLLILFMNPTARNVASNKSWPGIRAPWLGTKNIWRLLFELDLIDKHYHALTQSKTLDEWTPDFAVELYTHVAQRGVYIGEFAKCTQLDARPLKNSVFQQYKALLYQEIAILQPKVIVSLGNQVSENLLGKKISVSNYLSNEFEELVIGESTYRVYPTYYPVGQGQRNMPLAKKRIQFLTK
jgi:DNA polymerase